MIIDMHMHEMRYSGDSFLRLENMVEIAKRRGLDGICITDHDSMGLKEFAAEYSEKTGFPIFVGIEFYSLQGDIVAFGIAAAAAAQGAEPLPASLENSPRLTPFISTAPKPPAAT